jgi:thiol:disulfide interchange protein DsbD
MLSMRRFISLAFAVVLSLSSARGAGAPHTTAKLLLSHATMQPGETNWAGVQLTMEPGWHTYWRNSGDSGEPTAIEWKLPDGVVAGEILWPIPERLEAPGPLFTYGYHEQVVLLVPMTIKPGAASGTGLALSANLRWMECSKDVCLKQRGSVTGSIAIGSESKESADASAIEDARKKLPARKPGDFARAWWNGSDKDGKRILILEWTGPRAADGLEGDFFAFSSEKFIVSPATASETTGKTNQFRVRTKVDKLSGDWPKTISGLLVERKGSATVNAVEVELAVADARPQGSSGELAAAVAAERSNSTNSTGSASESAEASGETDPGNGKEAAGWATVLRNIGLGFLGGFILNLMPCVLPVIALKILGFVQQSQGSPSEVKRLGLIYGAGVLVSFLVLAGIVIALTTAGKSASWGMQFQNPFFVVAITVLVTLVALNLFGVFEVTLGSATMGKAGELASREGGAGAFFNGVLAVVLATPCTAPFMGVALGYAFANPTPSSIILIFSSVAVGLAFPYVLLSFNPRLMKLVPKPGPWMEHFKNAMGFPMAATAFWLLTLTEPHYGRKGVLWIGIYLVMVALAAWVWGQFVQRGGARKGVAAAVAGLILFAGYALALERQLHWRTPGALIGIKWTPWSAQAVEEARKNGKAVFVDFTADWCVICQANKNTSIEIPSTRAKLTETGTVPMLADFTKDDDVILKELNKFGRSGVPLVLVYPKDPSKEVIVLPSALTPSIVREALDKAAK